MIKPTKHVIVLLGMFYAGAFAQTPSTQPSPRFVVGHIDAPAIGESSGIVASRKSPGVFWTHNDSGNPPVLYAIDQTGRLLGEFAVDAANRDWEDIAIDDAGHLYVAETGNNARQKIDLHVYRVDEPQVGGQTGRPLHVDRLWKLEYPDQSIDC